ncbi:hypothetical protein SEA_JONJAMES_107 [Gordonia Phage JonJames]|nr:hypothetical protein SEA_JONJAMES_107 [Gordonia Phage JonJames]
MTKKPDLDRDIEEIKKDLVELYGKYRFIVEVGAEEGAYCEGWADGWNGAYHRIIKFIEDRGAPSLMAVLEDIERREAALE